MNQVCIKKYLKFRSVLIHCEVALRLIWLHPHTIQFILVHSKLKSIAEHNYSCHQWNIIENRENLMSNNAVLVSTETLQVSGSCLVKKSHVDFDKDSFYCCSAVPKMYFTCYLYCHHVSDSNLCLYSNCFNWACIHSVIFFNLSLFLMPFLNMLGKCVLL